MRPLSCRSLDGIARCRRVAAGVLDVVSPRSRTSTHRCFMNTAQSGMQTGMCVRYVLSVVHHFAAHTGMAHPRRCDAHPQRARTEERPERCDVDRRSAGARVDRSQLRAPAQIQELRDLTRTDNSCTKSPTPVAHSKDARGRQPEKASSLTSARIQRSVTSEVQERSGLRSIGPQTAYTSGDEAIPGRLI